MHSAMRKVMITLPYMYHFTVSLDHLFVLYAGGWGYFGCKDTRIKILQGSRCRSQQGMVFLTLSSLGHDNLEL